MAKISLRAYNREIETLIERGQSEEAIAHCKFILKTYPKHLDTYRLLGKAFLETQRYSEAADILLRILSVQPDDFVSQIGMSIIREDEGNLDAALFHMERAFEIQPSNAAIQDELRRLYGRRDGVEPPKLRLTRGALVRMYARGDLYRQATAEARAALAEDNQRVDIQIILARMYFMTGQKAEAAELSSKLVAKLPYCFEANRILAEVLPETSRAEDAKIYQQHLLALDPYLSYLSETAPTLNQVPDQVITLDRLEWTPSLEVNEQPAWANSLGISIDTQEEPKAEDWRSPFEAPSEPEPGSDLAQPAGATANEIETPASQNPSENQTRDLGSDLDELPAWMSAAGWGVSDQEKLEETPPLLPEPAGEGEGEPAPAEMPDWLKSLAPSGESPAPIEEEQQKLDWLSSILPSETDSLPANETVEVTQPTATRAASTNAPSEPISPLNEDLPDWLRSTPTSSDEPAPSSQLSEEPLPDWLTESEEDTPAPGTNFSMEEEAQPLDDLSFLESTPPPPAIVAPEEVSAQQLETPPSQTAAVPDLSNMDDAMAWLESLAAKQGAEDETLITSPENRQDQPPEWVTAAAQEQEFISPVTPVEETGTQAGLPVEGSGALYSEPDPAAPPEPAAMVPELDEAVSAEGELPEIEAPQTEPPVAAALSETHAQPAEPEAVPVQDQPEAAQPVSEGTPPAAPEAASEDYDSAFAWLESLAAKQGAESESLLVSPGERIENPPDWVKEQAAETAEEQPQAPEIAIPDARDWEMASPLDEMAASSREEIQPTPDLPDWLKSGEPSLPEPVLPLNEEGLTVDEAPAIPSAEPESAEWIQENAVSPEPESPEPEKGAPVIEEPAQPGPAKTGPLPRWLAAPLQEDLPESMPEPEEPELPDWLQEKPAGTPVTSEMATGGSEMDTPPLPDWLQNIESEKVDIPLPETAVTMPAAEPVAMDLSAEPTDLLSQAQQALAGGQINSALSAYNALIQKEQHIEDTIHDLKDALYRFPVESSIWQTLGDALFRANQVQDALDAYTKAEELLK